MALTNKELELWEKNKKYWLDRAKEYDKKNEKDILKIQKKLQSKLKEIDKEIKKELSFFYAQENITNKSDIEHLQGTIVAIDNLINNLSKNNNNVLTNHLKDKYIENYTDKMVQLGIDKTFHTINDRFVAEVIKTNWSGLHYSDRIWDNRNVLKSKLKEELTKGFIRGDSLQDISNRLVDKLNSNFNNTMRLVRTENSYISNKATLDSFKDSKVVEEYEFSAFLDRRTSPQCRELDGTIVRLENGMAGENIPPLHPNCRSCILPIVTDTIFDTRGPQAKETIEEVVEIPTDRKKLIQYFDKQLGIKVTDTRKNIDEEVLRGTAQFLTDYTNRYPKIKDTKMYKELEIKGYKKSSGRTYGYCDVGEGKILLNGKYMSDKNFIEKSYKRNIERNFHPPVNDNEIANSTFVHEFGHIINLVCVDPNKEMENKKRYNEAMKFSDDIRMKVLKDMKKDISDIEDLLSRYGATNSMETMAEAFAEVNLSGKPREFADRYFEYLDKELEKYK